MKEEQYKLIDPTTFEVEKPIPTPPPSVATYTIDRLLEQEQAILDQQERDNDQREIELAEVRELIQKGRACGAKASSELLEVAIKTE